MKEQLDGLKCVIVAHDEAQFVVKDFETNVVHKVTVNDPETKLYCDCKTWKNDKIQCRHKVLPVSTTKGHAPYDSKELLPLRWRLESHPLFTEAISVVTGIKVNETDDVTSQNQKQRQQKLLLQIPLPEQRHEIFSFVKSLGEEIASLVADEPSMLRRIYSELAQLRSLVLTQGKSNFVDVFLPVRKEKKKRRSCEHGSEEEFEIIDNPFQ